jgi:hypothetical protein
MGIAPGSGSLVPECRGAARPLQLGREFDRHGRRLSGYSNPSTALAVQDLIKPIRATCPN